MPLARQSLFSTMYSVSLFNFWLQRRPPLAQELPRQQRHRTVNEGKKLRFPAGKRGSWAEINSSPIIPE